VRMHTAVVNLARLPRLALTTPLAFLVECTHCQLDRSPQEVRNAFKAVWTRLEKRCEGQPLYRPNSRRKERD
jgi:hypothetical protein